MKAVIQRVSHSQLSVENKLISSIHHGFLVFLGIHRDDTPLDIEYMVKKITHLRVFEDTEGKMNLALKDLSPIGEILLVSQFTLFGSTRKGNRPSFVEAADPDKAKEYYQMVGHYLSLAGVKVSYGIFGEMMNISLTNIGPVTILIDTSDRNNSKSNI